VSSLIYLLAALTISVIGSVALWYHHRKPRSTEFGVDEFQRELRALAPERRESD